MGRLSGGEQARVLIARLMLEPADLLLLDEPTNDLDIPTLEVLEESLLEFPGALVLVTHDRYLLDRVSTQLLALDGAGRRDRRTRTTRSGRSGQRAAAERGRRGRGRRPRRAAPKPAPAAKAKRLSYREQREWEQMEARDPRRRGAARGLPPGGSRSRGGVATTRRSPSGSKRSPPRRREVERALRALGRAGGQGQGVTEEPRRSRAGESVPDLCRACKVARDHTVIAVDGQGRPLRVICGFCGSQHNYRGGGGERRPSSPRAGNALAEPPRGTGAPFDLVTDRERTNEPMTSDAGATDLEKLLRRVIREEAGLTAVVPADKWRGGHLVLRPGNATQEKSWPIETFFHKVVMLRNRLRTLEQQLNASALPDDEKVRLQTYVTGCYGSLTSFNVLFAEEDDQFRGAGGD